LDPSAASREEKWQAELAAPAVIFDRQNLQKNYS